MEDAPLTNGSQNNVLAEVALIPLENEEDNLETLSAVEEVTADVLGEISTIKGYSPQIVNDGTRSAGVIVLLVEITHQVIAQKDLLIALLQAGSAVLGALSKQKRVSKIEMTLEGDSITIENPEKATVQTLLALFEAKHSGIVAKITSTSILQVSGKVSNKEQSTDK